MSDSTSESSAIAVAAAGMAALAAAMGIGRFAFTPLLPMMIADAGLGVEQGGWLASANYAGYFAGALTAAALKLGPGRVIAIGLLVIAATTGAMGLTHGMPAWLALRFLSGVASAWVMVHVSAAALARLDPGRAPLLRPVVFAGVGTGIAITGLLCLAAMTAALASAPTWLLLGGLALVPALLVPRVFAARERPAAREAIAHPRGEGRVPRGAYALVACYGIFGFGYIIPATFLPAMAREAVGDPAIFGWSWPAFGAAATLSTLATARWRRAASPRALWRSAQFVMGAGVLLPAVWPGIASLAASGLLVGGTFMIATMAGLEEARVVAGPQATPLIAAMTAAFALGQIAGPVAAALAVRATGSFSIALVAASALLLASAAALSPRLASVRTRH